MGGGGAAPCGALVKGVGSGGSWGGGAGLRPTESRCSLQSPVAAKKEKKVSCMFIPDGRVSVSAQIDRKGFCEGEGLPHSLGGEDGEGATF